MRYTREENEARRRKLYSFLEARGDWVSMEEATDTITEYPAFFRTAYFDSPARRQLMRDIEFINDEFSGYERYVITGVKGIRII